MIDLRPLRSEDYAACVVVADWVDMDRIVRHGVAAWDGDDLVAVAGVLPYWPGVGEAWFSLGPGYAPRHLRAGVRRIRNFLALVQPQYRRIQADVRAGVPGLMQWIELLGFTFESEMPRYGPDGADYYRYVRFA
jgi:hypothetical protein